jgi:anti-sigma factor RsiW
MNCEIAAELIEALAAGEIERSSELGVHLDTCPRCAAELDVARLINQSLLSGKAEPPRHFTANVLRRLPSRTEDVKDGLEAWFDTMAALSLVPIILGIWFLADPAFLRQMLDTIRFAVSGLSGFLVNPGTTMATYLTVAAIVATVIISLGLVEEI